MIVKRAILIRRILQNGNSPYDEALRDFVDIGAIKVKGKYAYVNNINLLEEFYKKHCTEIEDQLNTLEIYGIKIKDLETLNNAMKLHKYFTNGGEIKDIRHLASELFGDSKTIQRSSTLTKIYKYHSDTEFTISYLKTDRYVNIHGIDITSLLQKTGFFAFFIKDISNISFNSTKIVIFENLYPFFKLFPNDSIFIYSSGFQNTKNLSNWLRGKSKEVVHFGDVDPSGLDIADLILEDSGSFYPDLDTIKIVVNDDLPFAEKEYTVKYKNFQLNEIAQFMKINNSKRIEQELITNMIINAKLPKPDWCKDV